MLTCNGRNTRHWTVFQGSPSGQGQMTTCQAAGQQAQMRRRLAGSRGPAAHITAQDTGGTCRLLRQGSGSCQQDLEAPTSLSEIKHSKTERAQRNFQSERIHNGLTRALCFPSCISALTTILIWPLVLLPENRLGNPMAVTRYNIQDPDSWVCHICLVLLWQSIFLKASSTVPSLWLLLLCC